MTVHVLKCWPEFFGAIATGKKRCEVRREDDRKFGEYDHLVMREWDPTTGEYTGDSLCCLVTHVLRPIAGGEGPIDRGILEGYVVLSIRLLHDCRDDGRYLAGLFSSRGDGR